MNKLNPSIYGSEIVYTSKGIKMILEYNGVIYESIDEKTSDRCIGCAFELDNSCPNTTYIDTRCVNDNIIWKPVSIMKNQNSILGEPKYTVDKVLDAVDVVHDCGFTIAETNKIKSYLSLQNDPEFRLYKELKAKFEVK